jgi:translation initiation factor RLI1
MSVRSTRDIIIIDEEWWFVDSEGRIRVSYAIKVKEEDSLKVVVIDDFRLGRGGRVWEVREVRVVQVETEYY